MAPVCTSSSVSHCYEFLSDLSNDFIIHNIFLYLLYYITVNSHTKLVIMLGHQPRVSIVVFILN